jgi:hypothetical protein
LWSPINDNKKNENKPLLSQIPRHLRGGTTKQSPIHAEIASFLTMTKNRAAYYQHINEPFFFVFFPFFTGGAGVGSRNDGRYRRWRGLAARAVLQGTGRHGLQVRASGDLETILNISD